MPDQFRLRLSLIEGQYVPELRCPHCGFWYTVDTENWELNNWDMCRACKRMRARLHAALKQRDEQYRIKNAEKARRYRKWLKETYPQYLQAYDREKRARNREKARLARARARDGQD